MTGCRSTKVLIKQPKMKPRNIVNKTNTNIFLTNTMQYVVTTKSTV